MVRNRVEEADADELSTRVRPVDAAASAMSATFELAVVEGPDRGQRWFLDGTIPTPILLGQSPACGVRLSDPLVSRRHAAIAIGEEPHVRISDLGSKNGTHVNGVRVGDAFLRGGEVVHVGDSVLSLTVSQAAHPVPVSNATSFGRVVGSSLAMRRLYPLCEKLSASDVPVVIEGETGTGKEVLAESLHLMGPRAAKPFMVFDCTAVAPSLMESELFGHERGAFTGAHAQRKGIFERCDGGTLLIDEIGDLDPSLQPKLLRVLQRACVRRVGGDKWLPVDVRVLAATRRDLDVEVQQGRFRDDLFFRLAVTRIELPPLRARTGDVGVLAQHFWRELGGGDGPVPYDLLQRCESYAWPGNVRELYNEIARRIALGELRPPGRTRSSAPAPADFMEAVLEMNLPLTHARTRVTEEFQRRYVERVLAQHGGNVTRAAAASGLAHRYFQLLRARQK
jgi:transcriptional regulator with GAF, ATPase, and Fis domain